MGTDQLTKQIDDAITAVNESTATEEYKLAAFKIILRSKLGQNGAFAPTPPANEVTGAAQPEQTNADEWQLKIANKLKISTEQVAALYHRESDGSLRLMLDTGVLSKNKQTATQDIAQLLAAGRVAAGFDETGTTADIIRNEAEYYGRLDTNNFARALHSLKPNFHYDAKEKTLTPRAPGFADAATVAKKYLGEEK